MEAMAQPFQGAAVAFVVPDLTFEDALDELADRSEIVAVNGSRSETKIARDDAKHAIDPGTIGPGAEVSRRRRRGQRASQRGQVAVLAEQLGELPVIEPALVPALS